MKNLKLLLFTFILLIILFFNMNVEAAGIGLSINKSTVTEGDTFTIIISGINGKVTISGNSNISINPSGTQWVEGKMTLTGTAKSAGTGTVTVTPVNASTDSLEPERVKNSASKSITIKAKETSVPTNTKKETKTTTKKETTQKEAKKEEIKKSDNTNLSSLNIKDFTLTPEFNKDTLKYYLSINQTINNLELDAISEDSKAKIEILGNEDIAFGTSNIIIKVTAEDGTNKEYIVEVNKQDTSLGLSSLSISSETENLRFSPQFDKKITNYTLNTENVSKLNIEALANYEDANIEIIGNSELKNGNNLITIKVQKDDEVKTYTLTVRNHKPSLIDKISTLWNRWWVVFIVAFCSLVQTEIAINYVIKYYKASK